MRTRRPPSGAGVAQAFLNDGVQAASSPGAIGGKATNPEAY